MNSCLVPHLLGHQGNTYLLTNPWKLKASYPFETTKVCP